MKEFIDKLIERLEEEKQRLRKLRNNTVTLTDHEVCAIEEGAFNFCKKAVNQLAEEYKVSEMPTGSEDYCEWTQKNIGGIELIREPHRMYLYKTSDDEWEYCPYCGKKIKVAPYTEGE